MLASYLIFKQNLCPIAPNMLVFTKRTYFSLYCFHLFIYNTSSSHSIEENKSSFRWRSTSNEAMCKSCTKIYSCLDLTYKLESVYANEKTTTANDIIPRIFEEKSGSSLLWLFGTNAQCNHGILVTFLHNVAYPLLWPLHTNLLLLGNGSLECL